MRKLIPTFAVALVVATASVHGVDEAADSKAPATQPARKQLKNLGETPKQPRFPLTERVWPAKPGEAHVCLWADDKYAAFSFTVDDNMSQDHAWWRQTADKYGFKVTWFVITGRVGTSGPWGTWEGWKKLQAAGHDVQSHTVTHLHAEEPGWKGVEWEYTDAIKHVEQNVPDHKVLTLAYPGGKNSKLNSRELAAKLYIAARGTQGIPNAANQTDYFNINATGGLHVGGPKAPWADIRNMFRPVARNYVRFRRGWYVLLCHGVKDDAKPGVLKICDYLHEHKDDVWIGLFTEVAQYGQERDTAKLTVTASSDSKTALTLTDEMDDKLFDFPLTVKVRLPEAWTAVAAVQGDKPVEAKIVEHEGGKFALVKAVPDRGAVTLTPVAQ